MSLKETNAYAKGFKDGWDKADKGFDEFIKELKEKIMETEEEEDGIYAKTKICSCGCGKLSHNPIYISDEEVCNIIDKLDGVRNSEDKRK